jgi:thioredoxin-related protein
MWGDREVTDLKGDMTTEKQFAEHYKVMYTPTLLFFDEQGEQVLRLNGYYSPDKFSVALDYVAGKYEANETIRDYAARVKPQRASGKLHQQASFIQPPYDLNQPRSKPLLVLFEQEACTDCDELHLDIMKRAETIEQMARLDIVLLDMWSDEPMTIPGGKKTSPREWAKKLGIQYAPSLIFFDENEEVFRAEAYLRSFHIQSIMDYVASGAYKAQPNFQRFIAARADELEAQGIHIDLMD